MSKNKINCRLFQHERSFFPLIKLELPPAGTFYLTEILPVGQINHSPSITTEEYAWEIKGAGLFSRDQLFSLRTPVSVKAGEQVMFSNFSYL